MRRYSACSSQPRCWQHCQTSQGVPSPATGGSTPPDAPSTRRCSSSPFSSATGASGSLIARISARLARSGSSAA
eukprot:11174183-Lingulodinium_polyedra.AAC.1